MFGLWAVARHTFRQCLRMKVAGVFILLLAVTLVAMPFLDVLKGDGTLSGRIRTFISYGTLMTTALLSLVTIFLTTGIVSDDVRSKQILSVVSKPLSRWQYIVGRWLGVVLLVGLLLAVSAAAIYGLAQYLRAGEALKTTSGRAEDRRRIEAEIFAARQRVSPEPFEIDRAVAQRIDALKRQRRYDDALEAYIHASNGDRQKAAEQLTDEIRNQVSESVQSAGPGKSITWRFSGINVGGTAARATGKVLWADRAAGLFSIQAPKSLIGKLVYRGPVRVQGVLGRVERISPGAVLVSFSREDVSQGQMVRLKAGSNVMVVAEPTIQVTYRPRPSRRPPDNVLDSYWEVQNPTTGLIYAELRRDAIDVPATLTVPARAVDGNGRTVVTYNNYPSRTTGFVTSVTVRNDDVSVLYQVDSFERNFLRGMALIFMQIVFLAALGTLAGSFVSFPVACLFCLAMLPFQVARGFLADAIVPVPERNIRTGMFDYLIHYVVKVVNLLLPDFGSTSPTEALVDGMNIPWALVGRTALVTVCVQTGLLLLIACLIFRKRELARVQV